MMEEQDDQKERKTAKTKDSSKKKKKRKDKPVSEVISEVRDVDEKGSDSEEDDDFWMPPVGERWDNDNGGDRWGSCSDSGAESDDAEIEGADSPFIHDWLCLSLVICLQNISLLRYHLFRLFEVTKTKANFLSNIFF